MKAIIQCYTPEEIERIARGEQTVKVCKTAPKDTPFKVYMYCTKDGYLYRCRIDENRPAIPELWNGKVVGDFICDRVEKYFADFKEYGDYEIDDDSIIETCLTRKQLWGYGKGKPLKGLHISDLKIYDKPRNLTFYKPCPMKWKNCPVCEFYSSYTGSCLNRVKRPPQPWQYVEPLTK